MTTPTTPEQQRLDVTTSLRPHRTAQEFKFGMEVLTWNRKQTYPPIDLGRELWVADEVLKLTEQAQAQAVEPVAWLRHDSFKAMTDDEKSAWIESGNSDVVEEYTTPLHLHPAPPPAGERAELIAVYAKLAASELRANQLDAQIKSQSRITAAALEGKAQQVAAPDADMFWNSDDADKLYSSISEFLNDEMCNGIELAVGDIRTLQRAVRLPNIDIRITSVNDEECDVEYEIVKAQGEKP